MNEIPPETRQQRGLTIAALLKITRRQKGGWTVPSQTLTGSYTVTLGPDSPKCTCPDHETRNCKCKHIFAVEYFIRREQNHDGSETITGAVKLTTTKRASYPQNWAAYNEAQTNEKHRFQGFLYDLCRDIPNPEQVKGRPRIPLSDAVFAVVFKIYSTFSGRRFIGDLTDAHAKGYISQVPHFNSIFNYLENPALGPILTELICQSSTPLRAIETDFAVDSTGFVSSRFDRWYDHKYGTMRQQKDWVKAHLMCGVRTNVVTAVEIHQQFTNDYPILPSLVDTTARNFKMGEVSADKAYSGLTNMEAIAKHGATPYIAFNAKASGARGGLFQKMFHQFSLNREEYLAHYHKRSNVESTVSMIKAKFRDNVRSKTDTAMKNEVLCKVLCHNICRLIHAVYEFGIDPIFAAQN
jgi:transposase